MVAKPKSPQSPKKPMQDATQQHLTSEETADQDIIVQIEDELSSSDDAIIEIEEDDSIPIPSLMFNSTPIATTSNGKRKRRILDPTGAWINESEIHGRTIFHEPPPQPIRKSNRKQGKLLPEETSWDNNPFRLVPPKTLTKEEAPFKVIIAPQVLIVMDFHAHLSLAEVIGLLGGKFESEVIHILSIFPCQSIGSHRECEMDPVSEMEATSQFASLGLVPVGWYHSHPTFEPSPSCRDIETQTMYQTLFKRSVFDKKNQRTVEPFLSFIISPFLKANRNTCSLIDCIHLADTLAHQETFRLPCKIDYEIEDSGEFFEYPDDLVILFKKLHLSYAMTANFAGIYEENFFINKIVSRLLGSSFEPSARSILHRFRQRLRELYGLTPKSPKKS